VGWSLSLEDGSFSRAKSSLLVDLSLSLVAWFLSLVGWPLSLIVLLMNVGSTVNLLSPDAHVGLSSKWLQKNRLVELVKKHQQFVVSIEILRELQPNESNESNVSHYLEFEVFSWGKAL
jgi:hypothetical protein